MNEDDRKQQRSEAEALAGAFCGSSPAERERLARIVDLLPCYVALIDAGQQVIFHNKAFERFFGKAGESGAQGFAAWKDIPGRILRPLDAPGEDGAVLEWVHQASGNAFRVHRYPFAGAGGPPCVLEVGFNITASLRVQRALDLSEQSYRAITDNLSIGIALLDTRLRIKAGNIRLNQWFGEGFRLDRRICELLLCGAAASRAAREDDFFCPGCPLFASLTDGTGHETELSVAFLGGMERILRLVTCPVKQSGRTRGGKPRVQAMILMLEDITNRLRVNQQLQRARKLEAMNTLAGGIAHEINQPLSALHLYAGGLQMLLEKQQSLPAETTRERLSLIMSEADKIRSIISHMRSLVMQEEPAPLAGVALASAVDNVIGIMRRQMESRGIRIAADIPAGLPLVRSNEVQFEQALVNLLANALHALDGAGPLDAKDNAGDDAEDVKDGGKSGPQSPRIVLIRARHLPEEARVRLEVADSGPGLQNGGERIFDPFYTTKERHAGMGLGLSIVHGLVSLWGAEISVAPHHPELGGASFRIDLRLAEDGDLAQGGEGADEPLVPNAPGPEKAAPGLKTDEPGPKKNASRRVSVKLRRYGANASGTGAKDREDKA